MPTEDVVFIVMAILAAVLIVANRLDRGERR